MHGSLKLAEPWEKKSMKSEEEYLTTYKKIKILPHIIRNLFYFKVHRIHL